MNPHEVRSQFASLNERLDKIEKSAQAHHDEGMKAHRKTHELLKALERRLPNAA